MTGQAGTASAAGGTPGDPTDAPAPTDDQIDLETILIARPVRDGAERVVDGVIEYANDAWRSTFVPDGVDPTGAPVFSFGPAVHPDEPRFVAFVRAAELGQVSRFMMPHPSHPDRMGELRVLPIGDRVLFVSHDATATQRALKRLAESERRYRELLDQVFDGVVVLDPDGRVRAMNRRVPEILGVVGDAVADLLAIQDAAIVRATPEERAESRRRLADGEVISGDAVVRRPDGTEVVVEQRAHRDPDGSTVIMIRDVTALRAADEASHERLAQEARAEALSRLAGGIAHDLNNHLTSILGYADLALADIDAPDQLANDLREVFAASERAQEVTRRFLAFGRRSLLRPRATDLADALASIEPALRHVAGNRLALILSPAPGLPPAYVDPAMLERALVALVENAREAMQGRGVLGITTSLCAEEATVPGGPWACIRIEDSGVGMGPDKLATVFDPFADGAGGGLGLPAVQGFVDQSGGHLRIASTPGEGTIVTMFLPLAHTGASPEPATTGRDGAGAGPNAADPAGSGRHKARPTVLLVDDEERIRDMAERVLERAGYAIVAAGSGEEALRVVADAARPIDLLFTDVEMPGMTGLALANVVRRQRPGIPVLVTSGYAQADIDREAIEGDSTFLAKPYAPHDLVDAVARALGAVSAAPSESA